MNSKDRSRKEYNVTPKLIDLSEQIQLLFFFKLRNAFNSNCMRILHFNHSEA
jgi:hypothetical protein